MVIRPSSRNPLWKGGAGLWGGCRGRGGGVFHHFSIFHFSEANKWLQMNAWPKKKTKKKNRHIPKIHPNTNVLSTKYLYMWTDCSVIKSREHRTVTLQACQWIYELFSHWDYYTVFFFVKPRIDTEGRNTSPAHCEMTAHAGDLIWLWVGRGWTQGEVIDFPHPLH